MDHETRSEFEQLCALTEIAQDLDTFLEIRRNLIRILEEKQILLNRQRPVGRVHQPTSPSNVA
jgi:hypothetical protein